MIAPDFVPIFWTDDPLAPLTAEETAAIDATIAIYAARHAKDKTDSNAPAGRTITDTNPTPLPADLDASSSAPPT
jgi:hypothetical protein